MSDVRQGLLNVALPGRFQVLPGRPATVLDVAHNPGAAHALARQGAAEEGAQVILPLLKQAQFNPANMLVPALEDLGQSVIGADRQQDSLRIVGG